MKQVTYLLIGLLGIGCSTVKETNQKAITSNSNRPLIQNLSDTTIRLPRGTSQGVWAGNTLYLSGSLDPDIKIHPTTEQQTIGLLNYFKKFLVAQHLTLGDVVMIRVYLGADPAKDGKMDFIGMQNAYKQFFGTPDQPNKPARTTVQVVLPAADAGALVEMDLIAVRSK